MSTPKPTPLGDSDLKAHVWVQTIDGIPYIRKWRLGWVAVATFVCHLSLALIFHKTIQTPFRLALPLAISTATMGGFILMAELQRQRILRGRWAFQIGLGTAMFLMTLAAIFLALVMQMIRADQRGHAANQRTREELEEIVGPGGIASIGSVEGRGISCHVARPDFDDRDLQALIECAAKRGSGMCHISYLALEGTAITSDGLALLSDCPDLTFLALPAIELTDQAVTSLASCQQLTNLLIPVVKSTSQQEKVAKLRATLPQLRINGIQ